MRTSFPKDKIKILLLENIHPIAESRLQAEGFSVQRESAARSEDELVELASEFHVLGIRSKTQITERVVEESKKLLSIGAFCIGTNQIALEAANRRGIPVFNAPYSNTRSVAELVIAEIISLSRQLAHRSQMAHQGVWEKSANGSNEIRGKTLGIVGYGHIGSQVSVLAESMGMKVVFYDITKKLPLGNSVQLESLTELFNIADFVSLHVPETSDTREMIGARELSRMKRGSYLINASRGSVVVIEDLVGHLKEGHLAGAAIDVFPVEPKSNEEKFESQLCGLKNVIITPHIGGSTEEAQESIGTEVSDSITKFINNGSTTGAVGFPNVDLPIQKECHRVLNVHKNVPGVLKEINHIVSEVGANIRAQYLSTDPNIGYLVMDLEKAEASEVSEKIKALSTSIKTRILF